MMKPHRTFPLLALAAVAALATAGGATPALAAGYATQDVAAEDLLGLERVVDEEAGLLAVVGREHDEQAAVQRILALLLREPDLEAGTSGGRLPLRAGQGEGGQHEERGHQQARRA